MSNTNVRVRFAPSPTGALHIGGVRTALYNYLFAKKHGGTFILRVEDTDRTRYIPGAEEYITNSLHWIGIEPDESPEKGGPYAPYRQSERNDIYKKYVQQLLDSGHAYYAFDTPDELEAMRERLKAANVTTPQYNSITRMQMKNSLTLPEDEVKEKLWNGEPYVIRIKVPRKEEVRFNDMVRSWVMVHSSVIDDKVLMKSDGMPTYHLANVVDDHLMKITHVIRGEEWLPSAPLHVLLYKFLGWEDSMPDFAHLPLLLKPDGNGKLSKRDAIRHGFPIFPLNWSVPETGEVMTGFKEEGYLPEALINFLAFLGWNPGTEQELFSIDELIEAFSIERIGKGGAKFDISKAKWFNQQYIKRKSSTELAKHLLSSLKANNLSASEEYAVKVCELMKERVVFPQELWEEGKFFFQFPDSYDEKVVQKKWTEEAVEVLKQFSVELEDKVSLTAEKAHSLLSEVLERKGIKMGRVMQAVRLALTGKGGGPDLMEIIALLGKEQVQKRIAKAISTLEVKQSS